MGITRTSRCRTIARERRPHPSPPRSLGGRPLSSPSHEFVYRACERHCLSYKQLSKLVRWSQFTEHGFGRGQVGHCPNVGKACYGKGNRCWEGEKCPPPPLTCPQRGVGLGPPWAGVRSDEPVSAAPGVTPSEDCVAFISEEASTQHLEPSRFSKKKKDLTGSALGR